MAPLGPRQDFFRGLQQPNLQFLAANRAFALKIVFWDLVSHARCTALAAPGHAVGTPLAARKVPRPIVAVPPGLGCRKCFSAGHVS